MRLLFDDGEAEIRVGHVIWARSNRRRTVQRYEYVEACLNSYLIHCKMRIDDRISQVRSSVLSQLTRD